MRALARPAPSHSKGGPAGGGQLAGVSGETKAPASERCDGARRRSLAWRSARRASSARGTSLSRLPEAKVAAADRHHLVTTSEEDLAEYRFRRAALLAPLQRTASRQALLRCDLCELLCRDERDRLDDAARDGVRVGERVRPPVLQIATMA